MQIDLPDEICCECGKIKMVDYDIGKGHYLIAPHILVTTCKKCLTKIEKEVEAKKRQLKRVIYPYLGELGSIIDCPTCGSHCHKPEE